MKIACPQCGQHYEVEAGMLDRYFRCTECQMLFRGLNAKPVKERKFKRKNKTDNSAEDIAANVDGENSDLKSATVAVAVADMEKEAAEAEARFWEKSLEEDALAEKAVSYRKHSINWMACLFAVCLLVLIVTFVLVLLANSKVSDLVVTHKSIDSKGVEYKERLMKLEQNVEKLQLSVQNINVSLEKLDRVFSHINSKVNDQTLTRKVDELGKELEKCSQRAEEIKKVSAAVNMCQEELQKLADGEKTSAKQRKSRR